jgi:hypothetical protein
LRTWWFGALPFPLPRTFLTASHKVLEYGDVSGSSQLLEEVSKLLEAYSQAILTSDF